MKFLLISDVESEALTIDYFRDHLSDIDAIFSCGDLKSRYMQYISSISNLPVFYVHGNHDDHYVSQPPHGCDSIEDRVIVFNGLRILGMGGCRTYTGGIFQYTDKQMWLRYLKVWPKIIKKGGIDVLVTHTPAFELGDQPQRHVHRGFKIFNFILDRHKPLYHFHGHNHLNYGRQEREIHYKTTRIINGFKHVVIEVDQSPER